jgi:hypothetical protein
MRRIARAGLVALAVSSAGCDPVHADAIAALGGEAPGVPPGPLHRPGQPCGLCHDGAFNDPPAFSLAGTLYLDATGLTPVSGAAVILEDSNFVTSPPGTSNEAGNFYWTPEQFTPKYPVQVNSVTVDTGVAIAMHSHIGGNGSCAGCHVDPPAPDSPGHIYTNVPPGMTP